MQTGWEYPDSPKVGVSAAGKFDRLSFSQGKGFKMTKFAIIENAKRQARMCFVGIAIPHQPNVAEGVYTPIKSEKILKFNRKALKNIGKSKAEKVDPRYGGGEDNMIVKVGKPGSWERVEALRGMYEVFAVEGQEVSAFYED
jgi:hypothetical protein